MKDRLVAPGPRRGRLSRLGTMRPAASVIWLLCLATCIFAAAQQRKNQISIIAEKRGTWRPI